MYRRREYFVGTPCDLASASRNRDTENACEYRFAACAHLRSWCQLVEVHLIICQPGPDSRISELATVTGQRSGQRSKVDDSLTPRMRAREPWQRGLHASFRLGMLPGVGCKAPETRLQTRSNRSRRCGLQVPRVARHDHVQIAGTTSTSHNISPCE